MPCYHGLIPDSRGECILVVPAGEGRWTLPAFEHDGDWFAYASTAVARSATERYRIPMTALHEHSVDDCRVCELEIQAQQWTPPAGTRWIARGDRIVRERPARELRRLLAILDETAPA